MKTSLTPGNSCSFLAQVFLMVARARLFPGAENTATTSRMLASCPHGLGRGSASAVFSRGLNNTQY